VPVPIVDTNPTKGGCSVNVWYDRTAMAASSPEGIHPCASTTTTGTNSATQTTRWLPILTANGTHDVEVPRECRALVRLSVFIATCSGGLVTRIVAGFGISHFRR